MRKTRTPLMLALAGLLASFVTIIFPGTASAAESIPPLQYPAIDLAGYTGGPVPGASGSVTLERKNLFQTLDYTI